MLEEAKASHRSVEGEQAAFVLNFEKIGSKNQKAEKLKEIVNSIGNRDGGDNDNGGCGRHCD